MWEVKEWGRLWTGPGTGYPDKQTKVMCQQPKNRDSGPRLRSGTAPGRLQEEEKKLQMWGNKQDHTAACTEHQQAGWEEESTPSGLSPQRKARSPDPQQPHSQHPKTQSWSGASALSHSPLCSGDKPPAWPCSPSKQLPALLMLYPGKGQDQCCPRTVRDARAPRAASAHTAPSPTW